MSQKIYKWHGIIRKLSPFIKSRLKSNPYREAVTLKFTLSWDPGEIEDQARISTRPFSKDCIILIPSCTRHNT